MIHNKQTSINVTTDRGCFKIDPETLRYDFIGSRSSFLAPGDSPFKPFTKGQSKTRIPFLLSTPEEPKSKHMTIMTNEDPYLFRYADTQTQNDKSTVLKVVKRHGKMLEFTLWKWKKDKEVVLAAIQSNWESIQYAHETLQQDGEIIMLLIEIAGSKKVMALLKECHDNNKIVKKVFPELFE